MKNIKSHLLFNARQRKGILYFLIVIVAIQITYFLVDFSTKNDQALVDKELFFQNKVDSLKAVTKDKRSFKITSFNPNYITDFKGYQLGMSTDEIDRLLAYRAQNKFVNSVKEFQEVTQVKDSLLKVISPYFKFPDWVTKENTAQKNNHVPQPIIKVDINKASEEDLKKINGIGEVLAKRIIQYRNKLGGFSFDNQLYEVWNLDKAVAEKLLEQFTVKEKPEIKKINVNTASFKEVLAIVYIDYELCKKIFDYKKEIAEYQSIEELKKINGFPIDKYDRIILYLDVK